MLHYNGLLSQGPGINSEPKGINDINIIEIMVFYDDELPEKSCGLVQEKLQKHFGSVAHIQVSYDKDENHAILEMPIIFYKKEDKSKNFIEHKSLFEEYYQKTIPNTYYSI